MTALLTRILNRLPIGWLQLTHNKSRLAAAVAGITFANLLVFVQLGIMAALNNSILASYDHFEGDILISATDANTLTEGGNVPRQLLFRSLAAPSVASATPIYIANAEWTRTDGTTIGFEVIGMDVDSASFLTSDIGSQMSAIRLSDTALIDTKTRFVEPGTFDTAAPENPITIKLGDRTITAVGTVAVGGGFNADGTVFVSDQTFLDLFGQRTSAAPNHILVKVRDGYSVEAAVAEISQLISDDEARVRSLSDAAREDQIYQTTERPTGLIFGFGVVMGVIVGVVIVYQILSTDVADHLREYATFKAMGYPQSFFLGIVFEEAFVLAIIGFVPGFLLGWGAHAGLAAATGLPVFMTLDRSVSVLFGTVLACAVSGAIATRRLAGANPADLF